MSKNAGSHSKLSLNIFIHRFVCMWLYLALSITPMNGFIQFSFDFTAHKKSQYSFHRISFHICLHTKDICLLTWFIFVFSSNLNLSSPPIHICLASTQTLWGCTTEYRRRASITWSLICKPNPFSSSFLPFSWWFLQ